MSLGDRVLAGGPADAVAPRRGPVVPAWLPVPLRWWRRPVLLAVVTAAVLHLAWRLLLATGGGDLAAQDAWAEFARVHPDSAYNLAWYGGLHPVSYSVLSPYVMATLGVRTTMILAGTVSAGLLALLLSRARAVPDPTWPALFGALALTGNAVSGRVTFGLGVMFGLAAVAVVFAWPSRWRPARGWPRVARGALAGGLAAVATASSPVAGLFVGLVAAGLWLDRRHAAAYSLGLPPVVVVVLSAWLFPFSGEQPMPLISTILPLVFGVLVTLLAPRGWRTVRITAAVYTLGVVAVWLVPSPIGTNVTRLALLFGGVVLAALATRRPTGRVAVLVVLGLLTSSIWQVATAARDVVSTRPAEAWTLDVRPLIHQLEARSADLARVEVVPARSHREASALAPYVNLARGWNRQADAERNPLFYRDDPLTAAAYHDWLDRWAVHYVVLSTGAPDQAAAEEAALVADGLPYLRQVWRDESWQLYEVRSPTPLAQRPAEVTRFDAAQVVVRMPRAGDVLVRVPDSPWLSLVDADGEPLPPPTATTAGDTPVNVHGCLATAEQPAAEDGPTDEWTVLRAPAAGTYRIAAPYKLPRGTACPDELTPR